MPDAIYTAPSYDAPNQVSHWIDGVRVGTSTLTSPIRITYTDGSTSTIAGRYTMIAPGNLGALDWTMLPTPGWTNESQEERQERDQRQREAAAVAMLEREAAAQRARELLFRHLTEEQQDCLCSRGYFHVVGAGGETFRILERSSENVYRVDEDGNALEGWCIVTREPVPLCDQLLAQKLMLEAGDPSFFEIAQLFYTRAREPVEA